MAPKKLYIPFVILVLILLGFGFTSEAATRGRGVQEKACKYMGACSTQAQCASMCNGAGFNPRAIYCDLHREGGAQCCCIQP